MKKVTGAKIFLPTKKDCRRGPKNFWVPVTHVIGGAVRLGLIVDSPTDARECRDDQSHVLRTRTGFSGNVGTLFATSMAPERASATTDNPGIEISTLMSKVDVAKLPATEIADLF